MKAFVTGGTGFIGSHLADTLISSDDYSEVRCLIRNNEKWLKDKDFTRVHGDLDDLPVLKKALKDVDVIFHIAGRVKAPTYEELRHANVDATENLLRIAQKEGVPKMVVLSSLAAAGPSQDEPLTEDKPMNPSATMGNRKKRWRKLFTRHQMGIPLLLYCVHRRFMVHGKIKFTASSKWLINGYVPLLAMVNIPKFL